MLNEELALYTVVKNHRGISRPGKYIDNLRIAANAGDMELLNFLSSEGYIDFGEVEDYCIYHDISGRMVVINDRVDKAVYILEED